MKSTQIADSRSSGTILVASSLAILFALCIQQSACGQLVCFTNVSNHPVTPNNCGSCLLSSCDPLTGVYSYGGWTTWTTSPVGSYQHTQGPPFNDYSLYNCPASFSWVGGVECAAILLLNGSVDIGVCFTAGIFTGGVACWGIIAGTAGIDYACCNYCNTHTCGVGTDTYDDWVSTGWASGDPTCGE